MGGAEKKEQKRNMKEEEEEIGTATDKSPRYKRERGRQTRILLFPNTRTRNENEHFAFIPFLFARNALCTLTYVKVRREEGKGGREGGMPSSCFLSLFFLLLLQPEEEGAEVKRRRGLLSSPLFSFLIVVSPFYLL